MRSTIGTYTSNRSLGPLGKVKVSKPISRGAAIIGLLEFLLGIGLLVGGVLLLVNDVNDDLDVSNDPKFYGLWSAPGPIIVGVFGIIAWWMRKRGMIITFSIINILNALLCVAQAVFVLPRAFWFKDFITLSKCRDDAPDGHGLYDPMQPDSNKRDCDDMNTIAKLFILLAICCCFAIVISIAGMTVGIIDNFIHSFFCSSPDGSAGRSHKHRVQTNGTKNSNVVRKQCKIFNCVNDSTFRESNERCE